MSDNRENGTVKWFNATKGYGFVSPDNGGQDVFVHITALQKAGLTTLNEGQNISFIRTTNNNKISAEDLQA